MTKSRSRTLKKYNANKRVPESVTKELIEKIQNLPDDGLKTAYLKEVFLEKFVSKDTSPPLERKERAVEKWLATERRNEATNDRIVTTIGEYNILPRVTFDSFVEWTTSFIEDVVHPVPEFDSLVGSFSGGSTTSRRRTESHPTSKFLGKADITSRAHELMEDLIPTMPVWQDHWDHVQTNVVSGNVMFTVPKNAEIDRVCCKEPDFNMFLQKGLGSTIRKGLRRHGVNLNDQTRNQKLAQMGSRHGHLATLDLSSASDSVSREVVFLLMPLAWYTLMDSVRSPTTILPDGKEHRNEMFSSMGNGFTFELESLLFYAISQAVAHFVDGKVSGVISVYGDDIICPTRLAPDLASVLKFFGFEVNSKKSFWTGPFRESCGGHFINGHDISPFYLREPVARLTDLIKVGNAIREWSESSFGINDPVYDLWSWIRDMVPKSLWGGREYSSILQLVTPHQPHSALQARKEEVPTYEAGGYLHWLNSTWRREQENDGVETSSYEREIPAYRKRNARIKPSWTVTHLNDLFLEEIFEAE